MRVIEGRNRARLALEPLAHLGTGGKRALNYLQRDDPFEARIFRLIDLAHPAGADGGENLVGTETSAGGERHGKPDYSWRELAAVLAWS